MGENLSPLSRVLPSWLGLAPPESVFPVPVSVYGAQVLPFTTAESGESFHSRRHVLTDKYEYWDDDRFIYTYAVMDKGTSSGNYDLNVQLISPRGETKYWGQPVSSASGEANRVCFAFNISDLPPDTGNYMLRCWFSHATGNCTAQIRTFTKIERSGAYQPLPIDGIKLNFPTQSYLPNVGIPAHSCIPLGYQNANSGDSWVVYEGERPIASQIEVASTYDPTGCQAWLLAYHNVRYSGGEPLTYKIKKGSNSLTPSTQLSVVDEGASGITVSNGYIKFLVTRPFAGLSKIWHDHHGTGNYTLIGSGNGGPAFKNGRNASTNYHASFHDVGGSVVVEASGPSCVVIKATGCYVCPTGGPTHLRYITRISAYNDQTRIDFDHAAIVTSGITNVRYDDMRFVFNADGLTDYVIGADATAYSGQIGAGVSIHQQSWDSGRLLGPAAAQQPSRLYKSDGYIVAKNSTSRVSLVAKDIWQKFPKQLSATSSGVVFHQWPASGTLTFDEQTLYSERNAYKFLNYHHGTGLDLTFPQRSVEEFYFGPGFRDVIVNTGTNVLNSLIPHGWGNSGQVQTLVFTATGSLPSSSPSISSGTTYYARVVSTSGLKVYGAFGDAASDSLAYDFTTAGTGVRVGQGTYLAEVFEGTDGNTVGFAMNAKADGVTIRNQFALHISPASEEFDAYNYQKLYDLNPVGFPTGTWNCGTQYMGLMAPRSEAFRDIEDAIDNVVLGFSTTELLEDYGIFNYGDVHHDYFARKNRPSLHRCWFTNHYYFARTLWKGYFRNNNQDYLRIARRVTDHYTTVDTHRVTDNITTWFHGKGLVHWAGDNAGYGHNIDPEGMLYSWLIDGDRWSKDTFELWKNSQLYYTSPQQATAQTTNRDVTGPMAYNLMTFPHSKEMRFIPILLGQSGTRPPVAFDLWNPHWPVNIWESTRNPAYGGATGVIVSMVDAMGPNVASSAHTRMYANAWKITGIERYITDHLESYSQMNRWTISSTGSYNKFGVSLGQNTNGEEHRCTQWPYYLYYLNEAGIKTIPRLIDSGDYPNGITRTDNGDPRGTKIYVLKETDTSWQINPRCHNIETNGVGACVISVKRLPTTGNELFPEWSTVNIAGSSVTWVAGRLFDTGWGGNLNLRSQNWPIYRVDSTGSMRMSLTVGTFSSQPAIKEIYLQSGEGNGVTLFGTGLATPTYSRSPSKAYSFTIPADGRTGLYEVNYSTPFAALRQPLSNLKEVSVIKNHNYSGWSTPPNTEMLNHVLTYTKGYLMPLKTYPIAVRFVSSGQYAPAYIKLLDCSGKIVLNTTLIAGQTGNPVTVHLNSGNRGPYYLDVFSNQGYVGLTMSGVNGNLDRDLALFGTDLGVISRIQGML